MEITVKFYSFSILPFYKSRINDGITYNILMSEKYEMKENGKTYFVTFKVVDCLDVFTQENNKLKFVELLIYCQKHKGLEIYSRCLMSNYLHMIVRAIERQILPDILRGLKKYTAKAIIKQIEDEPESRKEW